MKRYSVAMVAACPFPANYGTPGAILESSQALASLGHDIHVVTYPFGEDLPIEGAKVWRPRYWRKPATFHAGPSIEKLLLDLLVLIKLCRVIRRERIAIIHAHNYESALDRVCGQTAHRPAAGLQRGEPDGRRVAHLSLPSRGSGASAGSISRLVRDHVPRPFHLRYQGPVRPPGPARNSHQPHRVCSVRDPDGDVRKL